jgi:SAM-dependent methyltransferase
VGQAESEAGVEVKLGALDALPLAAASVDAILCVSALHEVDNKVAALTEFARVLRAGGMLSVSLTLAHCSACTTDEGHHSLGGAQRLLKVMGSLGFDEIDAPYSVREDLGESAAQGDVILTSSWMAQEDPASMPWASRRAEEHLTISCHIFRKRS